jgi:hypothetical protein
MAVALATVSAGPLHAFHQAPKELVGPCTIDPGGRREECRDFWLRYGHSAPAPPSPPTLWPQFRLFLFNNRAGDTIHFRIHATPRPVDRSLPPGTTVFHAEPAPDDTERALAVSFHPGLHAHLGVTHSRRPPTGTATTKPVFGRIVQSGDPIIQGMTTLDRWFPTRLDAILLRARQADPSTAIPVYSFIDSGIVSGDRSWPDWCGKAKWRILPAVGSG